MNEKNFDYLKNQVKFTGFGDALEGSLKENMQGQAPEFRIMHEAKIGNEPYKAGLDFKKSESIGMYFFNKYHLQVKSEQNNELVSQPFYVNKGNNITLKEGYNLLNGRSINKDLTSKEGQVYNAWLQLDMQQKDKNGNYPMKQFHSRYGFDLNKELAKYPIKELGIDQDRTRLMDSLHKGNRQPVTFEQNGTEHRHLIEANPQFKTINVYDSNMQLLRNNERQGERQGQPFQNSTKNQAQNQGKESPAPEGEGETRKTENKRSRKQGWSI